MTTQAVALVTGASGNLGRVVSARLELAGMRVVRVERTRALVESEVLAEVDLGSAASTQALMKSVHARYGRLDAVVHTVGTFRPSGAAGAWADDDLRFLFDTNVVTTAHVLSGALSVMLPEKRGAMAVVVSTAALAGQAMVAAYSASKAAQLRLVESAAAEVRNAGISIAAVLPGTMDTPQNRAAMPDADRARWVTLDEVADLIAFLLSPAGSALSGQALRVSRE